MKEALVLISVASAHLAYSFEFHSVLSTVSTNITLKQQGHMMAHLCYMSWGDRSNGQD